MMGTEAATKHVINKEIILASRPKGLLTEENFAMTESQFSPTVMPGSNDVILMTLWVSLDPYVRELMNETKGGLNFEVFELQKPIVALTLSKVIASDKPGFEEGDTVVGRTNVAEYVLIPGGKYIEKIDPKMAPLTYYLGILGLPGFTAWVGLNIVAQLKAGEEVYVTAAAGAVGLVVGQLAKLKGCRVVGSAGTDEKVKLLKEEFRFDDAFNYKVEKDWDQALKRFFPFGIDVYYDNVGGHMLEAVLNNINVKGRISVCGMISQYNKGSMEKESIQNLMNIVGKSIKMEGFLVGHYLHTKADFVKEISNYILQGQIKYKENVMDKGIHNFPKAYIAMLNGENIGKALLQVHDDGFL